MDRTILDLEPNTMKTRIMERTSTTGRKSFVIQQKHFLLRWLWVDAWVNRLDGVSCVDSFTSIEDARNNLIHFNGDRGTDRVVET